MSFSDCDSLPRSVTILINMKKFSIKEELAPFKERNIDLFLSGDTVFFLNFWLIQLNLSWVIYSISKSPLKLGILGFLVDLPLLILLPFAGLLADRFNRRRMIIAAIFIWFIPTSILIGFSWFSEVTMPIILSVGVIYGCLFAFTKPASDALIRDIVKHKEDMHRVIALDSAANKVTQFLASFVNGLLHILWTAFAVYIASFLLNLIALILIFRIKAKQHVSEAVQQHMFHEFGEGFRYVFKSLPIWTTMIMGSIGLIITISLLFQLPVFAGTVLKGNIHYLNFLYFAAGAGGMTGGVLLALRLHSKGLLKLMTLAMIVLGLGLIGFSLSTKIYISVIFMFVIDGCVIFIFASCAAAIQYLVEDEKRGRVMGIYSMFCVGLIPFGTLLLGIAGEYVGVVVTVFSVGILCFIAAILYFLIMPKNKKIVAKIYENLETTDSEAGQKLF